MNRNLKSLLAALLIVVAFSAFVPTQSVHAKSENCRYQRFNDLGSIKCCHVTATTGLRYVTPDPLISDYTLWGVYSDDPNGRWRYLISLQNVTYAYDKLLAQNWQYNRGVWLKISLPW